MSTARPSRPPSRRHVAGRAEVDVVGDKEGTRADRGCARGGMDAAAGRSRAARRVGCRSRRAGPRTRRGGRRRGWRDQDASRRARTGRRGCRALSPTRSPSARASAMQSSMVVPSSGTKGTTSVGAHARMLARVRREVDALAASLMPANAASTARSSRRDKGDDGAVVGRIGRDVEDRGAIDCRDGVANRVDRLRRRPSEKFGTHSTSFRPSEIGRCGERSDMSS